MNASKIGYGLALIIAFGFLSSVTYIYKESRIEQRVDERTEYYDAYEPTWPYSKCRQEAENDVQVELGLIFLEIAYIVFTFATIAGFAGIIWGLIAKPDIKRLYGKIQHPNDEITNVELFISNINQEVGTKVWDYRNLRKEKKKTKE